MKFRFIIVLSLLPLVGLNAQTTKEEVMSNILQAGGTYYSYPGPPKGNKLTPAPKGYKPFYISHYGRHGSRYMTSDRPYDYALPLMEKADKANALTTLGKDVLCRLRIAQADAYRRAGDLSKLGARQHQQIAYRMYQNFPEVLSQPIKVDATASYVMRCTISMTNFCKQLQALNPKLNITMDSSKRYMYYIANEDDSIAKVPSDSIMRKELDAFGKKMYHPDRLMGVLFSDKDFVSKSVKPTKLMGDLYNIAEDMQCQPELKLSFFDIFTNDELFDIWQDDNAGWVYWNGFFPSSTPRYKCHYNLLRNILDTADKVIRSGETAVTLRFGHDSVVSPLAFILHLKGCDDVTENLDNLYEHWANFKIIPMAANIQIIFYRKAGSSDILVKFLRNEKETSIPVKTDCAPYYHWKDVEAFYRAELAK
jgi:hypothetical protein